MDRAGYLKCVVWHLHRKFTWVPVFYVFYNILFYKEKWWRDLVFKAQHDRDESWLTDIKG